MQVNHTNLLDLSVRSSKQIVDRKHMHRDEEEKKKTIISYVKQRKMYNSIKVSIEKNQIIIKTERAVLCKSKAYSTQSEM